MRGSGVGGWKKNRERESSAASNRKCCSLNPLPDVARPRIWNCCSDLPPPLPLCGEQDGQSHRDVRYPSAGFSAPSLAVPARLNSAHSAASTNNAGSQIRNLFATCRSGFPHRRKGSQSSPRAAGHKTTTQCTHTAASFHLEVCSGSSSHWKRRMKPFCDLKLTIQ